MSDTAPIISCEDRVLRAILFGLAVAAQLLLPAIMLRAEAFARDLCVMQGGDSGTQKGQAHDEQCTQCRLHECSSVAPPPVAVELPAPSDVRPASHAVLAVPSLPLRRTQPPPTGPPLS